MRRLIQNLSQAHHELLQTVKKFSKGKREETLFGRWNLKDVLGHISAWNWYSIQCLNDLQTGREPVWNLSVQSFNKRETEKRKDWSFEKVLQEFKETGKELIRAYQNFPQELWKKKFWPERKWDAERFLKTDLEHYRDEHLPKIQGFLEAT